MEGNINVKVENKKSWIKSTGESIKNAAVATKDFVVEHKKESIITAGVVTLATVGLVVLKSKKSGSAPAVDSDGFDKV